jgi:hypothetical protein
MTQSSPRDPKNVPSEGQATRDLRLALRGLNYDLNTELESFRKWRQQTQKSSNARIGRGALRGNTGVQENSESSDRSQDA